MTTPTYILDLCRASRLIPANMNWLTYQLYIRGLEIERRQTPFDYSLHGLEGWEEP